MRCAALRSWPHSGVGVLAALLLVCGIGGATAQTDLAKPFTVRSALDFPPPEYLFISGREIRGALSGPVNTSRADCAFFTHPVFEKKGNSGRLFYQNFRLANRHDPFLPEQSVWFICWQPAIGTSGGRAQRLFSRVGYEIEEIETDGRRLLIRQTTVFGSQKTGRVTDTYKWVGDRFGQGAFVPEGAKTVPPQILPPRTAFEKHRDDGYALLSRSETTAAEAAFAKALALRPRDAACWFACGVAAEGREPMPGSPGLRRALAAYGKAIALQPSRTPACRRRAVLFVLEKEYAPAIADLTEVIRQEPADYENYLMRGEVCARKGDFARAAADAAKAARLAPTESAPYTQLAGYQYRGGDFPGATKSASQALALDDTENGARLVLAYIYARQNALEKAKKVLNDARNNGITTTERREGMAEIERILKSHPNSAALKTVYAILRAPE